MERRAHPEYAERDETGLTDASEFPVVDTAVDEVDQALFEGVAPRSEALKLSSGR